MSKLRSRITKNIFQQVLVYCYSIHVWRYLKLGVLIKVTKTSNKCAINLPRGVKDNSVSTYF